MEKGTIQFSSVQRRQVRRIQAVQQKGNRPVKAFRTPVSIMCKAPISDVLGWKVVAGNPGGFTGSL